MVLIILSPLWVVGILLILPETGETYEPSKGLK